MITAATHTPHLALQSEEGPEGGLHRQRYRRARPDGPRRQHSRRFFSIHFLFLKEDARLHVAKRFCHVQTCNSTSILTRHGHGSSRTLLPCQSMALSTLSSAKSTGPGMQKCKASPVRLGAMEAGCASILLVSMASV